MFNPVSGSTKAASTDFEIGGDDEIDANNVHGSISTLTDGATITPDADTNGLSWSVTLGGNRTIANPTNMQAGDSFSLEIIQDQTGSRTVTWGSDWHFVGGTAPTLTTTGGAKDYLGGQVNAAGKLVVFGVALDVKATS